MLGFTARLRALAALQALALLLVFAFACAAPATESGGRMGAVAARSGERGSGTATMTSLSAIGSDASETGSELDCRGYMRGGWVAITTAGFAAGTDLVGTLELLGGVDDTVATTGRGLPMTSTSTIPVEASLPTGLTFDAEDDGFTFADTFETNTTIYLPMQNLPPWMVAKFTRTSGGADAATITVSVVAQ